GPAQDPVGAVLSRSSRPVLELAAKLRIGGGQLPQLASDVPLEEATQRVAQVVVVWVSSSPGRPLAVRVLFEQIVVEPVDGAGERERRKGGDVLAVAQVDDGKVTEDVELGNPVPFSVGLIPVLRLRGVVELPQLVGGPRNRLKHPPEKGLHLLPAI